MRLMTEGVIWRQILVFSFPLIIGNMFQQLYNTVDSLIIGNFLGGKALAAVGAGTVILHIMIGLFSGFATGAGVVIAQFFGSRDEWGVRESVHTTAAFTICVGIAITALGISACGEVLHLISTPGEVFADALVYLRIYFAGILPLLVYNMGASILRAVGDSRTPLYYLAIAAILNTVLDYFFVAYLKMGIASVAAATFIAQTTAAAMVARKLIISTEVYRLDVHRVRFNAAILRRILRVGVPAGLQSTLMGASNLVVQSRINSFGTSAMAAWSVYGKIDGMLVMPLMSFGLAMMTFTGQNIGAGALDRVYSGIKSGIKMSCSLAVVLSSLICLFNYQLVAIFTDEPEILNYGRSMVLGMIPFYFIIGIMHSFSGVINGSGHSLPAMLIMLSNLCLVRIAILHFEYLLIPDIRVVFHSYIASWSICSLGLWAYYRWGGWRKGL
ncbi:MAG: MATE family efflux transporter [Synergistaceae bacterium]|jgi:putative MATE family efflux protein|nr:MATE family efflux transporter [Synergistaceae bacterium]